MVTTRLSLLNSLFHLNRSMAADAVSLSPPPPSPPSPPIPSPPPPPSRPPPPPPPSWIWPSCNHPRTCSFKVPSSDDAPKGAGATADTPYVELSEPCFSNSSVEESESLSTTSEPSVAGDVVEAVIRGLRSDRLVYEPCGASSMAEAAAAIKKAATSASASAASSTAEVDGRGSVPFEGSVAMALESRDPYKDFKASMEEMVAAQGGAKDWEWLEEMLAWYLQVNGKGNHVFIVGAFLDLLLSLASSTTSSSSNLSSTSSCSSSFSFEIREKLQEKEEDQRKRNRSCPHE